MRTYLLAAILTLAVCGALLPSLPAAGVAAASSETSTGLARMEQVIQSFVAGKQFMGSVLVARGNDKLLDKGYGYADLEWNVPDSPKTKYRLGSVTKQFTAASILLLQEHAKLNVHDPVRKYMPDAPAAWDKVTILNLLTHTSGIPNFTDFPDYESFARVPHTPEQLVKRFRDKPLDFQPGEKWQYSNSGYALLGYLIEKISGQSYQEFLEENVFKPMGMMESGYDSNFAIIPERASGYSRFGDGFNNASYVNMTVPFAAGGLYSTTGDLLRWEQSLFGGKLLSPASLKEMTTPFKNDYAFGLEVRALNGRKVIEHAGGIDGFNTVLAYYPEDKLTVVVLANLEGSAAGEISRDLGTLAEGGKVILSSERKVVHIDPKVFDGYVGSYQLAPNFILKVTRDGDRFITQATGQGPVEIFPENDHDFFAKAIDAQITFVTDKQGRATELVLHQGGRDQHAKRVE
jgi:CubicO group peptidase (beta-lactamase class C family)